MRLSPKKLQILTLVAKGFTDKEISQKLQISERTVQTHLSSILLTLNGPSLAITLIVSSAVPQIPSVPKDKPI